MERRKFIKACCYTSVGVPIMAGLLQSCGMYYANIVIQGDIIRVAKSEFIKIKKDKSIPRKFVLLKSSVFDFPICVYKIDEENYTSSLLKCTHQGCELNVGGGIYSCPCHGSEFSTNGKVLEGPADKNLKTFKTICEDESIRIYLS